MTDIPSTTPTPKTKVVQVSNSSNAIYGLGMIGAAIYFIQHASSFWMGIVGILEAVIWPILVVYKVLEFFHF